ncbi:MAG TPA: hypothetical protein VGK29_02155 [Paludibaculum sp.]|jgi:hypothetical protein
MQPPHFTRRRFAALLAAPGALLAQAPSLPRLRRADSYFGLHFDLHPNETDTALGRDVTEAMIENLLAVAKPDFVQYDSKGHPGWLGWPSQVGPSAPGIVKDSLAIWRRVTARRGVALYIHFSGVWDSEAVKRHPEWARLDSEGKPDPNQTSTYSAYVDELMIPQLREVATKYDLDGVWIDGECWATKPDYRPGQAGLPKSAKDAGWLGFLEKNREQFRKQVRHYVEELHRTNPKFQIASNWLYSTLVPEEPTLPVDFLSGDYLGNAPISTARLEARYLAQNGRPWDLMAWGFQQAQSNGIGHVHKPAVQLQQESSVVLAQGGGFQIYYVPTRAGYFDMAHIETMGAVGRYCRARQKVSQKTETIPQIGVVFSRESLYNTANKLFGGWGKASDPARGCLDALLACNWSVDVLPDWKLGKIAAQYPLIVLPDWADAGRATAQTLIAYAKAGGKLVVCGAKNAALFAHEGGVTLLGEPKEQPASLKGSVLANATGLWQDVQAETAKVLASRFSELDARAQGRPAATAATFGQGEVILIPGPFGTNYAATHAGPLREFLASVIGARFQPKVQVYAPPTVEVVLRRKDNQLLIHLLNATNMQVAGDFATTDFVPQVGPIRLFLGKDKPKSITLVPDGSVLAPMLIKDSWVVEIPQLKIHSVAVVVS